MSERTWDVAVSRDLVARLAPLAQRLADLLGEHCADQPGSADDAAFLTAWAASARDEQPADAPGDGTPATPLERLVARLGLTADETGLVLLAGLAEEHEGIAALLRRCHPEGRPHPTTALAVLLPTNGSGGHAVRAALRRLLTEGTLVRTGLLDVVGTGPWSERSLVLGEEVWSALHGVDSWPGALRPVAAPDVVGLEEWLRIPAVDRAVDALRAGDDRVLVVAAPDDAVATSRATRIVAAAGGRAATVRVRSADDAAALDLLAIHAACRGAVPVAVLDPSGPGHATAVLHVPAVRGPLVVCAPPGGLLPPPDRAILPVPIGPVVTADRRAAWRAALPAVPDRAGALAARHPLDPAMTRQVAHDLNGRPPDGPPPSDDDVAAAIRARTGVGLPSGVELRVPRAQWDDLVLAPEVLAQLGDADRRLRDAAVVLDDWGLRDRARADRGVRVLLSGPPGTGKTLAAEVLARAAGTDLLVVDVGQVLSKWVGETEKNLAGVFDVAERTQALLLLDEADGLFSSRTEADDANDRFLNLRTGWLLQRLDHFDGLAVLATNLRRAIDAAFMRRMDFVIELGLPDTPERRMIWDRHLPRRRADDVDLDVLAGSYAVPGAWIRNVSIAAAYAAAARGASEVTAGDVQAALSREYAKATRPMPTPPSVRRIDARAAQALADMPDKEAAL